jgi:threonine dehydrogenase-like Zn-dependent dehydrogenase
MLAMTYRGPSRVRIDEKPDPDIVHPGDAIVHVTTTTICGSDIHLYHGLVPDTRVGTTFGHEFAGVVADVGSSVETLRVGDRVVVPFNISCGACSFCRRGLTASCDNTNPSSTVAGGCYGYSHTTGGYDGGQAQYVRVPYADAGPMVIPDDMTDEDVLFLSDIFPTGHQAAEMGDIEAGATVVVFGAGPVGLFAAKSAWLLGAGRVIVIDFLPYRLDFARRFCGDRTETIDLHEVGDIVPHLARITDGLGPDVCIDAVGCEADGSKMHTLLGLGLKLEAGSPTVIGWAIDSVRRGGTVVLIGVYGPPWNLVPMGTAMNKGLTMRMAQCSVKPRMEPLLDHIRAGRVDAKALITHRMGLSEIAEAYDLFVNKRDGVIKVVLDPEA